MPFGMKMLAYTLLVSGPVMMVVGRPFTDNANGLLLCVGASMGIFGLFMRSRLRKGVPLFAVTSEDKAQFKELQEDARREFYTRKILGKILALFGILFQMAGVSLLFDKDLSSRAAGPLRPFQ